MNKIKLNKVTISSLCLLLLSLLIISTTPQIIQGSPAVPVKRTIITPSSSIDAYSDFWESAWVWVDHNGYINARAELNSKDLGFGEQNLNLFIAGYKNVYDIFDHANWWFWPTDDPGDQNTEVEIHFRTIDADLAREYADLIINYMSKGLLINYEYDGTWAWEDWRGDTWTDLTAVRYRSHIVWPWFTTFINDEIIPRDIGGLAETINVTTANNINAWAWPQGDGSNPEIGFSFGFDFNYEVADYMAGSYTLTMNELINTEKIQVNDYQNDLWINYALPDVTALTHTPSSNSSSCTIYRNYHPPPEPWVDHHYWDVDFQIVDGVYTDLSVSFDYNFVPYYLQTRVEASLVVNHYGYLYKDIYLHGDYSRVIDFESPTVTTHWDSNIGIMEMHFRPQTEGLTNDTFELTIVYNDTTDHYSNANDIAKDIETYLGIDFTNNYTEDNWWSWDRIFYSGNTYRFHAEDFTSVISQNLLSSSDVILSSPVFENQNIATSEYHQLSYYHPDVDQWIDEIDFRWNPLSEEVVNPTKTYSGSQVNLDIDLLSVWSWSSIPYCSNYSVSQFNIHVPCDSYTVYPRENNGWGWHLNTWEDHWYGDIGYVNQNLETYTDSASLEFVDENGEPNGTIFDDYGLRFDYTFLEDDVDTQPPDGNFYYHNFTSGEEYWGDHDIQNRDITFTGQDNHLHVRIWDDNSYGIHNFWWPFYYWNGTDWEQRFGSSGIAQTTVKAYFADLPAQIAQFAQEIPVTVWWEDGPTKDYNITWDTTGFADGEWTLVGYGEDNAGNWGAFGIHNLLVDNYDEATTAAPVINLLSAENETVYGTHTIQIEVTDDVDVYAVVLTRDFTAFLLNDSDSDDIYEFNWNTLGETENSVHYFTITVWDMDGHKVIYDFYLQVDNLRPGTPPTITIISPSTAGQTLSGSYIFEVEVTDDLGIESVKMQIDQGPMYTMTYNPTSGYYQRTHDLSNEINGDRILNITVVDIDENQHTEHVKIEFTVEGGQEGPTVSDPPEWSESHSDLPENLSAYVEAGNLNDYEPVSGDIFFEVAVMDDRQITEVGIKIQIVNDFDPVTGEPDLGRVVEDASMGVAGTDAAWSLYDYMWDSTAEADNYYLCEIDVQDDDTVVNHLYIRILIQVDNVEDTGEAPQIGGAPGFEFEILLLSLTSLYLVTTLIKRRRNK
ncbi:MAG: Ig-like domain-containing protein [Candidatus Thorarchaeota archaeon]